MKGKLTLESSDGMGLFDYSLYEGVYPFDYEITINTDLTDDFVSLISNIGDLDASIEESIEMSDDSESIAFYEQCRGKKLELLKNVEYVTFNFDIDRIIKYINDNPILKTKKILLTDFFALDPEIIKKIENAFGNETSNIYFDVAGNTHFIGFKEYSDTIKAVDNMVQDIERFNFSTLEKIMYAYDLVRNKVYVEVDENEDKNISRSLSSALLGDKIVCVGYARIFRTLLEKLGIKNREVYLKYPNKNGGHVINIIYAKDEKYGIAGVYYFDASYGSKKDENDNSYLSSYRYFAMTRSAVDTLYNGRFIDVEFPYFSTNIMWELKDIVDEKGFENISTEMLKSINYMSTLVNGEPLIHKAFLLPFAPPSLRPNKDKIIEELIPLVEKFNTPLSADILLEVLYNRLLAKL